MSSLPNAPVQPARGRLVSVLLLASLLLPAPISPLFAIDRQGQIRYLLGLLERKLSSDTASSIIESQNEQAVRFLERANGFHQRATQALADERLPDAADAAQDGLRAFNEASAAIKATGESPQKLVEENAALLAEIEEYHQGFRTALAERGPAAASLLDETELRAILGRARDLDSRGHHAEARPLYRQAQQRVIEAFTKLRNNETVVYSKSFRTKADEYRYEFDRFGGFVELTQKMIRESEIPTGKRRLFDTFVSDGQRLADQASQQAASGDYAQAVTTVEQANKRLIQSLRVLGLPVSL